MSIKTQFRLPSSIHLKSKIKKKSQQQFSDRLIKNLIAFHFLTLNTTQKNPFTLGFNNQELLNYKT